MDWITRFDEDEERTRKKFIPTSPTKMPFGIGKRKLVFLLSLNLTLSFRESNPLSVYLPSPSSNIS